MWKRKHSELLIIAVVLALLVLLIGVRIHLVDRAIGSYLACQDCFDHMVLDADLLFVYLATGALFTAGIFRSRLPGRFLHLSIGLIFLFYIADLLVFRLFNYRLFLSDVVLYFTEWAAVWDQFSSGLGTIWSALFILAACIGLLIFLLLNPPARGRPARVLLSVALGVAVITDLAIDVPPFVSSWTTDNFIRVNMDTAERVQYSPDVTAEYSLADPSGHWQPPETIPQSGRNVILVIVESWSNWHSKAFGGWDDWTPRLDEAAGRGLRFSNFHSIGFATANGLVGILGGQDIWSPFLPLFERTPFHSMWGIRKALPRVFDDAGYETAFLTTGPLSLYRKGEWMEDIGFAYVEGGEHSSYAEEERFAFNSPADAALYRRSLEWMQTADEPFFLVVETVSTHQPYIDPDSGERSLEEAMRYADRAFGDFHDALDKSGFFERGLLAVVSDHRSMTPIPKRELERFGPGAISLVPAFVIGRGINSGSVDNRVFSQGDLVPTFELWLNGAARFDSQDNDMLGDSYVPKCAYHERGDRRGMLAVVCPEGHGQIYLEGDKTRFAESVGLDDERKVTLLEIVARERIAGMLRQQQYDEAD